MMDKASGKEGSADSPSEAERTSQPGLSEGAEISIKPDDVEIIDPIEKWWDEEPEAKDASPEVQVVVAQDVVLNTADEDAQLILDKKGSSSPLEEVKSAPIDSPDGPGEDDSPPPFPPLDEVAKVDPVEPAEIPKVIVSSEVPKIKKAVNVEASVVKKVKKAAPELPSEEPEEPEENEESEAVMAAIPEISLLSSGRLGEAPEELDSKTLAEAADEADEADEAGEAGEAGVKREAEELMAAAALPIAGAAAKEKSGCWTVFTTLFFFGSLLLFSALAVGGVIYWKKYQKIQEEIASTVIQKLEEQGVYLGYDDWNFKFPRGLVLENVTLFEASARENSVVNISDIGVNVDILSIVKNRGTPESYEISFDDSSISLFEEGSKSFALDGIDAELFVIDDTFAIERFSATLGGIRVEAAGRLFLPEKTAAADSDSGDADAEKETFTLPFNIASLRSVQSAFELESSDGSTPLLVTAELSNTREEPQNVSAQASLQSSGFTWKAVAIDSLSALVKYRSEENVVHITNFQLGAASGFIGGNGSIDIGSGVATVKQLHSNADIVALASSFDGKLAEKLGMIEMVDQPLIQISGTVPFGAPKESRLDVLYEHQSGLIVNHEGRRLPLEDIRGRFTLGDGVLETNHFSLGLLGGDVLINGGTRITAESTPFNGLIEISGLPLERVASYFEKDDVKMTGVIYGDFRGVGYSVLDKVRGGGDFRIDEAQLGSFPVLGDVQALLGKLIPAFGISGKGSVNGAYIIESGVMITSDLLVTGSGTEISTSGCMKLANQTVDFTSTAKLKEALAAATGMEEKAITVCGSGPVSKLKLELKEFPIEFASEGLAKALGTTPESLSSLKEVLGEEGDASKVITGAIEDATGIELGPEATGLLKSLLGGGDDEPAPIQAEPIRALPTE